MESDEVEIRLPSGHDVTRPRDRLDVAGHQSGLLSQLAAHGILGTLPGVELATGKRPGAGPMRSLATADQDAVTADNHRAHTQERAGRRRAGGTVTPAHGRSSSVRACA
jgi:hypothetical protein